MRQTWYDEDLAPDSTGGQRGPEQGHQDTYPAKSPEDRRLCGVEGEKADEQRENAGESKPTRCESPAPAIASGVLTAVNSTATEAMMSAPLVIAIGRAREMIDSMSGIPGLAP